MSASQPENDRDYDALKRAQRSHEASMDEILASIRAIIADDKANGATHPGAGAATRPAPAPTPQVIYSNFGQAKSPAESPAPISANGPTPQPVTPTVVWSRPDDDESESDFDPGDPPRAEDEPLLSQEADRAIAASFKALAASVAMPSPERMEEMAREALRPMVKAWLDENLPNLVERLVRAEIQRVARGGR